MIFTGAVSSDQSCGAEKTAPLVRLRVELAIVARLGRLNTPPVAALSVEFAMLTRLVASNSPVTVWLIVTESIETACGSWYTGKPRLNRRFWLSWRALSSLSCPPLSTSNSRTPLLPGPVRFARPDKSTRPLVLAAMI